MGNTVVFGPYRFVRDERCLFGGGRRIRLQEKPYRALDLLVSRAGAVVTREELRWALWPDGEHVDFEHGINTVIKRLRVALGDSAEPSCFVATVPRRGYRFVAQVRSDGADHQERRPDGCVGRQDELRILEQLFQRACDGASQCVLVTGEAGIGKTTLIRHFLDRVMTGAYLAESAAIATYGPGDPFGPVVELLRQLAGSYSSLGPVLATHAPCWMPHVPGVRERGYGPANPPAPVLVTEGRMCREAIAAFDAAAGRRPLVLVVEDLHWADGSTLALVHALARRRGRSRTLLLCSWRTSAGGVDDDGVAACAALAVSGVASRLAIGGLTCQSVRDYVRETIGGGARLQALADVLHARTEGNPLFVTACVHALQASRRLVSQPGGSKLLGTLSEAEAMLPGALMQVIMARIGAFAEGDRRLLEAASLFGPKFTNRQVAAALGADAEWVGERMQQMCRPRDVIRPDTSGHGMPVRGGFAFVHALYPDAFERSMPGDEARGLHGAVADVLQAEAESTADPARAAGIAVHLEKSGQLLRAANAYAHAADVALARAAHGEAVQHARRGLSLLTRLPSGAARDTAELALSLRSGAAVSWTHGFSDPSAVQAFQTAVSLCERLPDTPAIIPALLGLNRYYGSCGPIALALDAARRALRVVEHTRADVAVPLEVLQHLATVEQFAGELMSADASSAAALELLRQHEQAGSRITLYLTGLEASAVCRITRAYVLWYRGQFGAARDLAGELVDMLPGIAHEDTRYCTLAWLAVLEAFDEDPLAAEHAQLALAGAGDREEAINYRPFARLGLGRAEGLLGHGAACRRLICAALQELQGSWRPIGHAFLAESWLVDGAVDRALCAVADALRESTETGIRYMDAELLRLRGEARAASDPRGGGEWRDVMQEARMTAERQGAAWQALRIATTHRRLADRDGFERDAELERILAGMRDETSVDLARARDLLWQ